MREGTCGRMAVAEWFGQATQRGFQMDSKERKRFLGTATYSPEDNKLRFYPFSRLSREDYDRAKAAGFRWAPRQELFVAPMWTPDREDLLTEWCGEIEDEDKSLVERAEERSERFEEYSASRAKDADQAHRAVKAIADNIPLGQPILVGHHSERHARRDAEKVDNGMRRAVKAWKTSKYWEQRAAGAIRHAKYKEQPAVRARRIKGLEADQRKQQRNKAEAEAGAKLWGMVGSLTRKDGQPWTAHEQALCVANRCGGYGLWSGLKDGTLTVEQAREQALKGFAGTVAWASRWLEHYANRLTYERAMLAEAGGTVADRTKPEKGGAVRCWASPRGGWSYIHKVNQVSVTVLDNWGNGGKNFTRTIPFDKLGAIMSAADVATARAAGRLHDVETVPGDKCAGFVLAPKLAELSPDPHPTPESPPETQPERPRGENEPFEAMAEQLRNGGVKVVSAPGLFPTPPDVARRMVELAELKAGDRVLEPSAGLGAILDAISDTDLALDLVAVEINQQLATHLRENAFVHLATVEVGDFFDVAPRLGRFNAVLMNPPFTDAVDIRHMATAWDLVQPGGRLVAICAAGPRQAVWLSTELAPSAVSYTKEELPPGTFNGTGVRALLVVARKPEVSASEAVPVV